MTGDEMGQALARLGWSSAELANRLAISPRTVSAWLSGRRSIPPNVAEWLLEVADYLDRAPRLPRGW